MSLSERCSPREDKRSVIFFKVTDAISELGNPYDIRNFTLIYVDELESEVFKLKNKWAREFDNLSKFFEEYIRT